MSIFLRFFFVLSCFPLLSHSQFACSGLDRVDIYLNSKLVATSTAADAPTIKLSTFSKPDTITFHAYTNWEGLRNSTLDVKDEFGELIDHVNSTGNTGYEAVFTYVFDLTSLDDPNDKTLDVFVNLLCERETATEQVCTINLAAK
jgi:hypothetical protein